MLRRVFSLLFVVRWPWLVILSLVSIVTASCGDLQDPGAGAGQTLSTPAPTKSALTQPAPITDGMPTPQPAGEPIPVQPMVTLSTTPGPAAPIMERAQSEQRQETTAPMLSAEARQQSVEPISVPPIVPPSTTPLTKDPRLPWIQIDRTPRKSVTLAWDPSDRATGYRVKVRSLSSTMQYNFDAGLQTELTLSLPLDQQYSFTVVAYNHSGESAPSDIYNFALY